MCTVLVGTYVLMVALKEDKVLASRRQGKAGQETSVHSSNLGCLGHSHEFIARYSLHSTPFPHVQDRTHPDFTPTSVTTTSIHSFATQTSTTTTTSQINKTTTQTTTTARFLFLLRCIDQLVELLD